MLKISRKIIFTLAIAGVIIGSLLSTESTHAVGKFALSPMYQLVSLIPGETYYGNFNVVNPGDSTIDFYYSVRVEPFSVGDDNELAFVSNGDYNQIVDWIELPETQGMVSPNQNKEVRFAIHVPENAAAGGQYAAITISSGEYDVDNRTVDVREVFEATHLIYADVAGETVRKGNVSNVNVPGFLFSGNITGSASVANNGNVHSQATQTMQVFPIFSNEEVFTNEEDPKVTWIMPGATNYSSVTWESTPSIGIFHVIYNVEYEGVESKVDKIVIVCPLWLLFLILLAIFLIIFKILSAKKTTKKKEA